MVNASLNWASIVGIVLAVCGAGLYFLRSFKPALARDYDVFFAAIGLLCGGILFFQGWRLDPILQFGQFLLAGTTVFFAYESVRLRGVATDQARRSSYFEDEPSQSLRSPRGGLGSSSWEDSYDQFEEPKPMSRRFSDRSQAFDDREEDSYSDRRVSRAAIPEEAASRRSVNRQRRDSLDQGQAQRRRMDRFRNNDQSDIGENKRDTFGERRNNRQNLRRGTRPSSNGETSESRRSPNRDIDSSRRNPSIEKSKIRPQGSPRKRQDIQDAAFSSSASSKTRSRRVDQPKDINSQRTRQRQTNRESPTQGTYSQSPSRGRPMPRDNSSRFDD